MRIKVIEIILTQILDINKSHFKFHHIVGKGGFGRVISFFLRFLNCRFGKLREKSLNLFMQ